ncbi:MAG: PSP1 C-terminal domain-containing protein, partial [Oscillospiraceae bacterium]
MVKVVSVKFNPHGKAYYFDPSGIEIHSGDTLIVETSKGLDIGDCAYGEHYVTDESIIPPLRPVIRTATEEDLRIAAQNKEREKEAFAICKEKIEAHKLD